MKRIDKELWVEETFFIASVTEVQRALASGCSVNHRDDYGRTPLHWVVFGDYKPGVITALVNAGADVNAADTYGVTPLHFAAGEGHYNTVASLLAFGADVHAKDSEGATPLHWAADYNTDPQVTRELLNAGAQVDAQDEDGVTPLHWAAKKDGAQI